ncbi:LCP family protein [Streptomyces cavernicola]|uniref:LCP family protein n=1 Tax=Streptomyces cavernicola TaxID=3043613 RepID=A0ABT6S8U8_9ACTN|nr:LCP family protein [Streptomyces sp. B-S-A6]MDI3404526.1 LCP family protein [Streptomyces sp. B-S-A6]
MADESDDPATNPLQRRRKGPGGRRRAPRARSKALVVTAWAAASVVLAGGIGLGYVYFKLNGNINGVDINAALGTDRPDDVDNGSMDILVLGSDSREGANAEYGSAGQEGSRSDTAMVVHVYEGHKKASVVSIPRDTLVTRPACRTEAGTTDPGGPHQMFNESYSVGGPACAVKTVEKMSGIRMDHYLEVDFTGFKKLIDELGGVEVTTEQAISDPNSHLNLAAGTHRLDGEQSLGLVRTRHAVGDGGDLGRIQLQQAFIKALLDQIKDVGVFSHPKKLYDLADTATKAVTTDSELDDPKSLIGFANSLKGIESNDMNMVTLPVTYDPADPNRVVPLVKQDKLLWAALRSDQRIPASVTKGSAGDKGGAGSVVSSR